MQAFKNTFTFGRKGRIDMWTYIKKDEVKVSILLVFFLIFTNTPYALRQISVIRGLFVVVRFLGTGVVTLICFYKTRKCNRFDIGTLLFCLIIFISAFHAGLSPDIAVNSTFSYLHIAYSYVVFIVGQLFIIKIAFSSQEEICLVMMKTIYGYYLVLSLINLATQILGLEIVAKGGNTFFLGLDSNVGKYYLFAFFYACVVMVLEEKDFSWNLFLVAALTAFGGAYRKIGVLSAIGFLMAGLVLLFFLVPKLKIWNIRQDIFLGSLIGIYMLVMGMYTKLDGLQTFINHYLFGKANALADRFALQRHFLSKWPESPFWGWASILSQEKWGETSWFDYALRGGHTHNYLIETLYNFGIFAFLLFIILLLMGIRKISGYRTAVSFIGVAFLLVLLRGMFENSCQDIFAVLPTVYYLGGWCDKKYRFTGDNVKWQEILN